MSNLEELYQALETFRKNQWPVPNELQAAIDKSERELIEERIVSVIREAASPMASSIHRPFRIIVDYQPERPLTVKLEGAGETKTPIIETTETAFASNADAEEDPEENEPSTKITRKKSIGFKVTFPDGTVFQEPQAVDTFILALQKIGLERIANDEQVPVHAGYRVVDRRERVSERATQRPVDGFFVYTNIGNDTKVEDLQTLSQRYGIGLVITMDESEDDVAVKEVAVKEGIGDEESPKHTHPVAEQFRDYLVRASLAPNTVNSYLSTLENAVSGFVTEIVDARATSIFEFNTEEDVQICIDMLKGSPQFIKANDIKHNSMTAALNKYLQFVRSLE